MTKLLNISELSKLLDLIDSKTQKPSNHILRFWEKEFKQIKPTILNKRRYYSLPQTKLIKLIKFLLKDQGMTIKGAKKVLNYSKPLKLDETKNNSINAIELKNKLKKISNIIKQIKKYKY